MKPNRIMCIIPAGIVAGIFMFSSCHSGYSLASVEGSRIEVTAALDANPDSAAIAVLAPYQKTVDSIMSPVIGQSARFMDRFRPESELSNLVADILRYSASAGAELAGPWRKFSWKRDLRRVRSAVSYLFCLRCPDFGKSCIQTGKGSPLPV